MIANLGLAFAAGIVAAPSEEEVAGMESAMAAMVREATAFLRSNGVLTWSDWSRMDRAERMCFIEAGRVVTAERASIHGIASQGLGEAVAVGAESDGGEAMAGMAMGAALESVVRKATSGAPVGGGS